MKEYPYFIPGYTGFCPELREHFGKTYGHATRHIIQKNPQLKERLAPVQYKYRRFERPKGTLGKHRDHEKDKYDHPISKHRTGIHEAKHRTDYDVGDAESRIYHLDYKGGDAYSEQCCKGCGRPYPSRVKNTFTYADGDRNRKSDHEYACPKYVFIKGFAECVQPKMWTSESRPKLPREYYPCVAVPCAHMREYSELCIPSKGTRVAMPRVQTNGYHPSDCGHKKDAKIDTDRKLRKMQRVRPHRYGGVIPKYTGHIPGMQSSFGESYGPVSDRLLRKHQDRMKEMKIKL